MEQLEKWEDDKILEFVKKIKNYSVRKLKKMDLKVFSSRTGFSLLNFAFDDLSFMERLLKAGININHKDSRELNIAYHVYESKNPCDALKLLMRYEVDLKPVKNKNPLQHISKCYDISSVDDEKELTRLQLLLLSHNPELINPQPSSNEAEFNYNKLTILASLMPDVLYYLVHYKNEDILDIKDGGNEGLLFHISDSQAYNYSELALARFGKVIDKLFYKDINLLNDEGENLFWGLCQSEDKIKFLKSRGLDINQKNKWGLGVLESRPIAFNDSLAEYLVANGAQFSIEATQKICNLPQHEVEKLYLWDTDVYKIMLPLAQKQFIAYEKEELSKSLNESVEQVTPRKNRL